MYILHSDVEISSSYYVLHVSLSSGMSSGPMNGGDLLGWVCIRGGDSLWGP